MITFPEKFASADAIQRALYRLADRCSWEISQKGDEWQITLLPASAPSVDLQALEMDFKQTVLDYGLREKIRAETEQIRSLFLAQAFSKVVE